MSNLNQMTRKTALALLALAFLPQPALACKMGSLFPLFCGFFLTVGGASAVPATLLSMGITASRGKIVHPGVLLLIILASAVLGLQVGLSTKSLDFQSMLLSDAASASVTAFLLTQLLARDRRAESSTPVDSSASGDQWKTLPPRQR